MINPKRLYYKATSTELSLLPSKAEDEERALQLVQTKVLQRGLPMQIVAAEFQWCVEASCCCCSEADTASLSQGPQETHVLLRLAVGQDRLPRSVRQARWPNCESRGSHSFLAASRISSACTRRASGYSTSTSDLARASLASSYPSLSPCCSYPLYKTAMPPVSLLAPLHVTDHPYKEAEDLSAHARRPCRRTRPCPAPSARYRRAAHSCAPHHPRRTLAPALSSLPGPLQQPLPLPLVLLRRGPIPTACVLCSSSSELVVINAAGAGVSCAEASVRLACGSQSRRARVRGPLRLVPTLTPPPSPSLCTSSATSRHQLAQHHTNRHGAQGKIRFNYEHAAK